MDDALIMTVHVKQSHVRFSAITGEGLELTGGIHVQHRQQAILGGDGMVHHRKGEVGAADFTSGFFQSGEGLGRGAFVDQMAVNVDERGLAGLFGDQVRIPDFFVDGLWRHRLPEGFCTKTAPFETCVFVAIRKFKVLDNKTVSGDMSVSYVAIRIGRFQGAIQQQIGRKKEAGNCLKYMFDLPIWPASRGRGDESRKITIRHPRIRRPFYESQFRLV